MVETGERVQMKINENIEDYSVSYLTVVMGNCPDEFGKEANRCPLYRSLGWPQGRCGLVWKNSPPPAFDPPNVQRVASCYSVCAIRPTYDLLP